MIELQLERDRRAAPTLVEQLVQGFASAIEGQSLRAGVLLEDGKYDVSLYANNATNQHNYLSQSVNTAVVVSSVGTTAQLAPPAMYGVTLRAKF